MGALFSSPPSPPPIPVQPPAAAPATFANPAVQGAGNMAAKTKGAIGAGVAGTTGTSPEGLMAPPTTANATLLGGTQ